MIQKLTIKVTVWPLTINKAHTALSTIKDYKMTDINQSKREK